MIPILYEHGETSFTTNGICRLPDCVSCKVAEVINGLYECTFEYPMTGKHYDQIIEDRIIYTTHDDSKIPQPFDIYKRTSPMNGVVTFYAKHISNRLNKVILEPYTATTAATAVSGIADHSINHNAFTFTTSITSTKKFQLVFPASVRNALGADDNSILSTYGGEVEWNKFSVAITSRRGMDRDVQLRFGKNLEDIRYESDITETYNAIVPYWKSSDGKMLKMLPEKVIYLENVNNGTYDDLGDDGIIWSDGTDINPDDLFSDSETGSTSTGNTSSGSTTISDVTSETKAVALDLSSEFDDVPSDARLREVAIQKFNESLVPLTNIEVRFFELWNTTEYEKYASLQRVFLGDTVGVIYTDLGVNTSKRVVKVVYDSLLERYESMELGTVQKSFGTTVAAKVKQEIMKITPTIDIMAEAIDHGTELLRGGLGGHVVIGVNAEGQPNEILILDTDSIETAVHVLRININGIGFSSTGYNGTYNTAWTLDGTFYADFITAGTLSANRIKAGIIAPIVGMSFLNMLTGEFKFGDDDEYISFQKNALDDWFLEICTQNLSIGGSPAASQSDVTTALSEYDPADGLNQQKVFNLLSNNGAAQGIWIAGGQLYFSFSYARGGTLQLGGTASTAGYNGVLEVYSANGSKIATLDKTGANFNEALGDVYHTYQSQINGGRIRLYITGGNDNKQKTVGEIIPNAVYDSPTWTYYMRFSTPQKGFLFCKRSGTSESNYTYTDIFKILTDGIYFLVPVYGGMTINGGLTVNNGQTVNGELTTNDGITNNGGMIWSKTQIYTQDYVYGTAFVPTSDRRLKKNIKPCDSDIIMNLNVVSFDWKKDGEHVSAGMIAQEVEKICPDLVRENPEGYKGINYAGIVPHLVKKVQEQQKEIDNLKKEIVEIKALLKGVA